jgi:signal transduction histidine kinase
LLFKKTNPVAVEGAFFASLILLSLVLAGCQERYRTGSDNQPAIKFTKVPVAGADDPGKTDEISGQVIGGEPGQQIVLYSKGAAAWWVQPFANQPFTKIRSDSTWVSWTHPGSQYAALLVGPTFQPPPTAGVLPTEGVFAIAVAQGEQPFWLRWWFPIALVGVGLACIVSFYRLRLHRATKTMKLRFEERLAERTRVAQELHDTLLQGVISASMLLDVAVDRLPADSPIQPDLRHIMRIMEQVIEEGRTTLRGLRLSTEGAHDMELALLRVPEELGIKHKIAYRVLVEGTPQPLQTAIHDEVYSIGREAIVNAFRHSGATKIDVELEYTSIRMRVLVRDNGRGIKAHEFRTGSDGHWGLSGMRERAKRIGAKFKIISGPDAGTEVELTIPRHIFFQVGSSNGRWRWLSKPMLRLAHVMGTKAESEKLK